VEGSSLPPEIPLFRPVPASLGPFRRPQAEARQVEGKRRAFRRAEPLRASPQQKQQHFPDTLSERV